MNRMNKTASSSSASSHNSSTLTNRVVQSSEHLRVIVNAVRSVDSAVKTALASTPSKGK